MIRDGYENIDIQLNILRLLEKLHDTVSPYSRWKIVESYPQERMFSLSLPIVYIECPDFVGMIKDQQGGRSS